MGNVILAAGEFSVTTVMASVTDLASSAWTIISGNPVLVIMFVAGLIPVGFKVIKSAKKTSN